MSIRKYQKPPANPKVKVMGTQGFQGGLQELSHPSAIKDNELSQAVNVEYKVNGEVKKRRGHVQIGNSPFGTNKVINGKQVVNIGTFNENGILENRKTVDLAIFDDGYVRYLNQTETLWEIVPNSPQFNTNVYTNIVQAMNKVYFLNEVDPMCYWDGSTWHYYNAIANPTVAMTAELVKEESATGNRKLYYCYAWFNSVGNTAASAVVEVTGIPDRLNDKNYIKLTIPSPPEEVEEQITAVGIWRGSLPAQMGYLSMGTIPVDQTEVFDKGLVEEDDYYTQPKNNTTGGFHFKIADTYRNSLMGTTVELGDDTIVFSANDDKFGSFGRQDGGGYYGWRRGEGTSISSVKSFSLSNTDYLFCFKRDKIGAFQFDEAGGSIKDINLALGSVSHKSVHQAAQDLRFWSENGVNTLRNEANYATIIRVGSLSIKADDTVKSVTALNYDKVSGIYYDNLSLFSIPMGSQAAGNNAILSYDERFSAWSIWKGINVSCMWHRIDPEDNVKKIFAGGSEEPKIYRLLYGKNDDGRAINFRIATKQFSADKLYAYKKFRKLVIIFGTVSGLSSSVEIVADGKRVIRNFALANTEGYRGFASDLWGVVIPPETTGTFTPDTTGLIPKYANLTNKDLFTLQAVISNSGIDDEISVIGFYVLYTDSSKPLSFKHKLRSAKSVIQPIPPRPEWNVPGADKSNDIYWT